MRSSPKTSVFAGGLLAGLLIIGMSAPVVSAGDKTVHWVLPAGQEDVILGLVAPYRTQAPIEPGTWFDRIALYPTGMDFVVEGREPPAGPVTIKVQWSETTASIEKSPRLWLTIDGLSEDTPENLARSVGVLHGLIDGRLGDTLASAFLSTDPGDSRGEILVPISEDVLQEQGMTQVSWDSVAETAPGFPQPWWLALLGATAMVFVGLGIVRRQQERPGWEAAWGLLLPLGGLAAWWLTAEMSSAGLAETIRGPEELEYLVPMHRDLAVAAFFIGAALAALLGVAAWRTAAVIRSPKPRGRIGVEAGILLGLVTVSLLVRFGLGGMDLLTDGGTGFERVLKYGFGYGGTSLLVTWLLPASVQGQIWPAVAFTSTLAALAPGALYVLARELGFSRSAAVASALALLCWPVHAALYTSDFLQGPILTIGLVGLCCLANGVREERPAGLLAGAAVFGGLIWMRPEAMIWALPYAAVAAPLAWRWRRSGALWTAAAYGGLAVGCRLLSFSQSPGIVPEGDGSHIDLNFQGFLLAGHAALPWWLWVGIPVGIPVLWGRHRVAGLVVAGGMAAYIALRVGGCPPDLLEFFRYLTPAMAWVSLVVGLGMVRLASLAPEGRARQAVVALLSVAFLATPLIHMRYLGTSYAPRVSDEVFRQALAVLPAGASVIVPGEHRQDGLDPSTRFRFIAREEYALREDSVPVDRAVSAATFMEFVRTERRLPDLSDLDLAFPDDALNETRWYYFRSGECLFCQQGEPEVARDPGQCRGVEDALALEPVQTWSIPYRNHRLVTQPLERRLPKYDDDFTYVLYRVRGLRTAP